MPPDHSTYKVHTFFDADENIFYSVNTEEKMLLKNGADTKITRIPYRILLLLIENEGRTVRDEEFFSKVWGRKFQKKTTLTVQINKLRSILADNERQRIIETRSSNGYRFTLKVETEIKPASNVIPEKTAKDYASKDHSNDQKADAGLAAATAHEQEETDSAPQVFETRELVIAVTGMLAALIFIGAGLFYRECADNCFERTVIILVASVFYGLLAGVGVMLECAYQFDKYGWNAAKMIPSIIFISGGGMFAGLCISDTFLQTHNTLAFLSGLSFLIIGALLSCAAAYFVIPNIPIAKADFQTQPAFTAFYKNIFLYFLPLYTVFVLLIYCIRYGYYQIINKFGIAILLIVIWIVFFFFSFITTSFLSDKLLIAKDGEKYPYHGFYVSLLIFRLILCFGPTGISLMLYLWSAVQ